MKFPKLTIILLTFLTLSSFANKANAAITLRPALNLGLVGYWSMEEGTGTQAGDSSGNGNTGTIHSGDIDDFNRADNASLGANWQTVGTNEWDDFEISGNMTRYLTSVVGYGAAAVHVGTFGKAQYSQAKFSWSSYHGPIVRFDPSVSWGSGYSFQYLSGTSWAIRRWDPGGGHTDLGAQYTATFNDGDVLRLEIDDNDVLTPYVNGVAWATRTDHTYQSGNPGFTSYNYGAGVDDWEGGNLNASWTDGKRGKALDFNGTGDYVSVGESTQVTASGSVTQANMKMSVVDGTAFADFSSAGALTNHLGKKVVITDSAGKKLTGYIKAAGTGETLGSELMLNTAFNDTANITPVNATVASVGGGQSGNALQVSLTGAGGYAQESLSVSSGILLKASTYEKLGTATYGSFQLMDGAPPWAVWNVSYFADANWTQTVFYGTANASMTAGQILFIADNISPHTMLFDTASVKQVLTPSATGVTIASTANGATFNWASEESGFNRNDTAGYTYVIYGADVNTLSFWAKPTTTTQYAIDLDGGTHYVWINSGTVTATGFDNPTIYVDGAQTSTFPDTNWHHIAVTTATSFTPNNVTIGKKTSSYFSGSLDEVRVYNRALSGTEVSSLYQSGSAKILTFDDTGLVGYWGMEEGTGTQAGDSSGNGNTGDITGASWTDGKRGKALGFNGTSDYVDAGNGTNIQFDREFTLSAWTFLSSDNGNFNAVISKGKTDWSAPYNGFSLYWDGGNNRWDIEISDSDTPLEQVVFADSGAIGTWKHVTASFNNGVTMLYIDGELKASGDFSATVAGVDATLGNLMIGRYSFGTASYFNGQIDEVRVYDRALDATEIANLYNSSGRRTEINSSQTSRLTSGLVGMWSFDGPDVNMATNTAYDRSGNANNGTITGATQAIGKVGQGMSFNGTSDYVDVPYNSSLMLGNTGTISLWYKPATLNSGTHDIISYGGFSDYGDGYLLSQNGSDLIVYWKTWGDVITVSSSFVVGNWYHLTLINNNGVLTLYKNGQQIGAGSSGGTITGTLSTFVGGENTTTWNISGLLDEARIYDRALSPGEVQQLYNMGR